jgi:hypothetical protein
VKFTIAIEAGTKKTAFGGPAEKINITVPALTLRRIDAYVESHKVDSRSAFLVKAAEEAMRRETEAA